MKNLAANLASRRLDRGKANEFPCLAIILATVLCFAASSDLLAQNVEPFAIRTETDLVLVPTVVLKKNQVKSPPKSMYDCFEANRKAFSQLSSSAPYLPEDCDSSEILSLTAKDFLVFDDGVEEKIETVTLEPNVGLTARDNFGYHQEWSYTSRGIWSSTDLQGTFGPGSAGHFYLIGYSPQAKGGNCHSVKVKVDLPNTVVFSRNSYCVNKPYLLMGPKFREKLERALTSSKPGRMSISYQTGFFYTGSGDVRLYLALEVPWDSLSRRWQDGRLQAEIGLLGQLSNADHKVVQSFDDFACCLPGLPTYVRSRHPTTHYLYTPTPGDLDAKIEVEDPILDEAFVPTRYETQINLSSGNYVLRLVFSDNNEFSRLEIPLNIEPFARTGLNISSIVLCRRFRNARAAAQEAAATRLAPQYIPLVSKELQFTPTGDTNFARGEVLKAFFEVYEPLAKSGEVTPVHVNSRIVNAKTGAVVKDLGLKDATGFREPGSHVVPIWVDVPVESLPSGSYRVEIQARDAAGRSTIWREANFALNR
jgi:hypothetical protein